MKNYKIIGICSVMIALSCMVTLSYGYFDFSKRTDVEPTTFDRTVREVHVQTDPLVEVCIDDHVRLISDVPHSVQYEWYRKKDGVRLGRDKDYITPDLTETTEYELRVYKLKAGTNLVENGGFEWGNVNALGFDSQYRRVKNKGSRALYDEGVYGIGNIPHSWHSGFDRYTVPKSGNWQMIVNGATDPAGKMVWGQNIAGIHKDKFYMFSAWGSSVCGGNPANLKFTIKRDGDAERVLGKIQTLDMNVDTWLKVYEVLHSDKEGDAYIKLVNLNKDPGGNDFALDDVVFQEVEVATYTVKVKVSPKLRGDSNKEIELCPGSNKLVADISGTVDSYVWTDKDGKVVGRGKEFDVNIPVNSPKLTYKCTATSVCGEAVQTISINVKETIADIIGSTTCDDETLTIRERYNKRLYAPCGNNRSVRYTWTGPSGTVLSHAYYYDINAATKAREGIYTCTMQGACLTMTKKFIVYVKPTLVPDPSEDRHQKFLCASTNELLTVPLDPAFDYQWWKFRIGSTAAMTKIVGATSNEYTVRNISKIKDEGYTYLCRVSMKGQPVGTGTYFDVEYQIIKVTSTLETVLTTAEVTRINTDETITAYACENLVINAPVISDDIESYKWVDSKGTVVSNTKKLSFVNIDDADAGEYTCILKGYCNELSHKVILKVARREYTPSVKESDYACVGEGFILKTNAEIVNTTFTWRKIVDHTGAKCDIPITNTENQLILRDLKVTDAGTYECIIRRACTEQQHLFKIKKVTPNIDVTGAYDLILSKDEIVTKSVKNESVGEVKYLEFSKEICEGEDISIRANIVGEARSIEFQKLIAGTWVSSRIFAEPNIASNGNEFSISNVKLNQTGKYRLYIEGRCGYAAVQMDLLVKSKVKLTSGPREDKECLNSDLSPFEVVVTNANECTFVWTKADGSIVPTDIIKGAKGNILDIDVLKASHIGEYTCTITNSCSSETVKYTVKKYDAIKLNNETTVDELVCEGGSFRHTIDVTGEDIKFVWDHDGVLMSTLKTATLNINNMTAADAGIYTCRISNKCNTETVRITLRYSANTVIASTNINQRVCEGSPYQYIMNATGGNLRYTWTKDNVPFADPIKVSDNKLKINSFTDADSGVYVCKVVGDCGEDSRTLILRNQKNLVVNSLDETKALCAGDPYNYTIDAIGENIVYTWTKDGLAYNTFIKDSGKSLSIDNFTAGDAGVYRCVVSSNCGAGKTIVLNLSVSDLTNITSANETKRVCEGTTYKYTLAATGANLNYTWTKNGIILTDATKVAGNVLTINNFDSSDDGIYVCKVVGECGEDSRTLVLTNQKNLVVSSRDATSLMCNGEPYTYTVNAEGENITYKWTRNGTPLLSNLEDGGKTLSIPHFTAAHNGTYICTIESNCGTAKSIRLDLKYGSRPSITSADVNTFVCQGDSYEYKVQATGESLTYIWEKDGSAFKDPKASGNTLHIDNFKESDSGMYLCRVKSPCGEVVQLIVLDNQEPLSVTSHNVNKDICDGESYEYVVYAVGNNLTYTWTKDGAPYNTNLIDAGRTLKFTSFKNADRGVYKCVVNSGCGNKELIVDLGYKTPTVVTSTNEIKSICKGTPYTYDFVASGENLVVTWTKDGVAYNSNLENAGKRFNITNFQETDEGVYVCTATGDCGEISRTLNLTYLAPLDYKPVNIKNPLCEGAYYYYTISAEGGDLTYSWTKGPDDANQTPYNDATHIIDGGKTLMLGPVVKADEAVYMYTVNTPCGASEKGRIEIKVSTNAIVLGDITQPTPKCAGENFTVDPNVVLDGSYTYYWIKKGDPSFKSTDKILTINNMTKDKAGDYIFYFHSACWGNTKEVHVRYRETTEVDLGVKINEVKCEGDDFTITPTVKGEIDHYEWTKTGDPTFTHDKAELKFTNLQPGQSGEYSLRAVGVGCGGEDIKKFTLVVKNGIKLTDLGVDRTICDGDPIHIDAVASGTGATFKWIKLDDASIISNTKTLNIANFTKADEGTYQFTVSGDCGEKSDIIKLNYNPPVLVKTVNIDDKYICDGDDYEYTVYATGSSLTYDWDKDGVGTGNKTNKLSISGMKKSDEGTYTCTVNGDCGRETNYVKLLHAVRTKIVTAVKDSVVCIGSPYEKIMMAQGTNLVFEWTKDGNPITVAGVKNNELKIANMTQADAGEYVCTAKGICGEVSVSFRLDFSELVNITSPKPLHAPIQVCHGKTYNYTLTYTGTNAIVSWTKDGAPFRAAGANNNEINILAMTPADAGVYTAEVKNSCGNQGLSFELKYGVETKVTSKAIDTLICPGATYRYTAKAVGEDLHFAWTKDGVHHPGTGPSGDILEITNMQAGDAGVYECTVSGDCEEDKVIVKVTCGVNTQVNNMPPATTAVCDGARFIYTVDAVGNNLKYEWFKEGVKLPLTGSTFTIENFALANVANYKCVVKGTCGQVEVPFELTFSEKTEITTAPLDKLLCPKDNFQYPVLAKGVNNVYTWTKDGGVYIASGAHNDVLVLNDVKPSDAGTYICNVKGDCGESSIKIQIRCGVDSDITSGIADETICANADVTYDIEAVGTDLKYEWKKDGVITSNVSSSLSITSFKTTDAGRYECKVTGACKEDVETFTLTYGDLTSIVNKPVDILLCPGDDYTNKIVAAGVNNVFTWTKDGKPFTASGAKNDELSITNLDETKAGIYECTVRGLCGESSILINIKCAKNVNIKNVLKDSVVCSNSRIEYRVDAEGTEIKYSWDKDGKLIPTNTTNTLVIDSFDNSNVGVYTCTVTGKCTTETSSFRLDYADLTDITSTPVNKLLCPGDNYNYKVQTTGYNNKYVWTKDGKPYTAGGLKNDELVITNMTEADAGIYQCTVKGLCGESGVFVTLSCGEQTRVLRPRVDTLIAINTHFGYTVKSKGTNLTYKWTKDGSSLPIKGPRLDIDNFQKSDVGVYRCQAIGLCGTSTAEIHVDFGILTKVISFSHNKYMCEGETTRLEMIASGMGDLKYEWYHDGNKLSETSANLSLSEVKKADAGMYKCIVYGKMNKVEATNFVKVYLNPSITIDKSREYGDCNEIILDCDYGGKGKLMWTNDIGDVVGVANYLNIGTLNGGMYKYKALVTNDYGCAARDSIIIDVSSRPSLGEDKFACEGESISIRIPTKYNVAWNDGSDDAVKIMREPGKYDVKVVDKFGCKDEATYTVYRNPKVELKDTIIFAGDEVKIKPKVILGDSDDYTLDWSTGDFDDYINVSSKGRYSVKMIDENGCIATASMKLSHKYTKFVAPNALLLDAPGQNGKFFLKYKNIRGDFLMVIYNREGIEVYRTSEPGMSGGWNGYVDGKPSHPGAYVWVAYMNEELIGKGFVMVVK